MAKKSRQSADKFAYKLHPIHFHESEKCQALEVQIVGFYTVEIISLVCDSLDFFAICSSILDSDTINYVWLCLIVHFHAMKTYGKVEA